MPTAIEDCITTILGKLIKYFVYTSISKNLNMSKRSARAKHYSLHEYTPIRNGLKFDKAMDVAIVDELVCTKEINSGNLKRKAEETLGRTIKVKTYYNHLQRLQNENIVHKRDTGNRGIESVYYSLTAEAEKLTQLKLLRTYSDFDSFKKIYANILFRAITEPGIYGCDSSNLNEFLSYIHISIDNLVIDNIKKEYPCGNSVIIRNVNNPEERILPEVISIYYKPISNVRIIETISYRNNTRTNHIWEQESFFLFHIPGISIKEFIGQKYVYRPSPEAVERAFLLLLKSHLIRPAMEYRGETRYVLADDALRDLIKDINLLDLVEDEQNNIKSYYRPPATEEIEKQRLFYTEEKLFREYFYSKELRRAQRRKKAKDKEGEEFKQRMKVRDQDMQLFDNKMHLIVDYIKQKHQKTLEKYAFLLDNVGIIVPSLIGR